MSDATRARRRQVLLLTVMAVGVLLPAAAPAGARELIIRSNQQLSTVLRTVKAGRTLKLDPGTYRGGLYAKNLAGTKDAPIVIWIQRTRKSCVLKTKKTQNTKPVIKTHWMT